jgi:hypothetical protein
MLHHYVFLKFAEETPKLHVDVFCQKISDLSNVIEEIKHLEIGLDELHEERSWDLVLIMQFASVDCLRAYQKTSRAYQCHEIQCSLRN